MGACIGAAIGAITLIVMPQFFPGAIYWGAVLFGIFCFPVYAICAAHLNDYVEPGEYVEASSGLLMVFALGAIAGPLLASLLMRIQGPSGLFIFIGGIHLCIAGYSLYRCRRRAPPPAEDRASFTETLVMSKMAAEIDPRPISDQKMDNGNAEKINAEGTEDSYNK